MTAFKEIIKAIIMGVVEGITEWLPISSTGHMIILEELLGIGESQGEAFFNLFLVVIQLGAILAVIIEFFRKLWPFGKTKTAEDKKKIWRMWLCIVIASVPAAIIGLPLDDFLDEHLYNFITVSITLVVYGIAFLFVEQHLKRKQEGLKDGEEMFKTTDVYKITYKQAVIIGCAQILSLIPGTSRSGITIIAALLLSCSREVSTEFSFYLAIPAMLGGSLFKTVKFMVKGNSLTGLQWGMILTGSAVALLVSILTIKFFVKFIKNHPFTGFGYYRIALGLLLVVLWVTVFSKDSGIAYSFEQMRPSLSDFSCIISGKKLSLV